VLLPTWLVFGLWAWSVEFLLTGLLVGGFAAVEFFFRDAQDLSHRVIESTSGFRAFVLFGRLGA
jgi:hypothetical protein